MIVRATGAWLNLVNHLCTGSCGSVEFVANQGTEVKDHLLLDRIENLISPLLPSQQIRFVEGFQLFGDIGLRCLQLIDQFVDGKGAFPQQLQNRQSGGFGKNAEQLSNMGELRAIRLGGFRRHFDIDGKAERKRGATNGRCPVGLAVDDSAPQS